MNTSIVDFFNPADAQHLRAFAVLERTGVWPLWYIAIWPNNGQLDIPTHWHYSIVAKITDYHIKCVIGPIELSEEEKRKA